MMVKRSDDFEALLRLVFNLSPPPHSLNSNKLIKIHAIVYTRSNKLNANPGMCQLIIRRLSFHPNQVYYCEMLLLQTPNA